MVQPRASQNSGDYATERYVGVRMLLDRGKFSAVTELSAVIDERVLHKDHPKERTVRWPKRPVRCSRGSALGNTSGSGRLFQSACRPTKHRFRLLEPGLFR